VIALALAAALFSAPPDADLDGDSRVDRIELAFTGGAHCCYRLTVHLTSTGADVAFPFQLDGGGPGPRDTLEVSDHDGDGVSDLLLTIETYNGERLPIPRRWTRRYGIRTHTVLVTFARGRPRVRDWPRRRR
jgi:hypothetical protein